MIYRSFLHLAITGDSNSRSRSGLISLLHHLQRLIKLAQHMIELEVYSAGVRDLNKILELDHQLEATPACVARSIAITTSCVASSDESTITFREICSRFIKLGLEPRFVGAPPELRSKPRFLNA